MPMPVVASRIRIGYSKRFGLLALEVSLRHQDRRGGAAEGEHLQKAREVVEDEAAAEGDDLAAGQPHDRADAGEQQHDRAERHDGRRALAAIGAEHQQQHCAAGQDAFPARPAAMRGPERSMSCYCARDCGTSGGLLAAERLIDIARPAPSTEACDMSSTGFG